ncbi:GntR family transcriptional regulator [Methylobacterium radiodurans]|uniref:GntR family transcriptional regulator n=1 Tax=Methylobacterium radiodurans TaxID=2202828 RepID=UPI001FE25173|nr:GntR family transcriptional regulator [Methylobacterium radiodurans]
MIEQLAAAIADHIRRSTLSAGERLPERQLAEKFRVSRTPVREALRLLADRNVVGRQTGRGYVVAERSRSADEGTPGVVASEPSLPEEESAYLRIAEDRFAEQLPERITERELIRRYGLSRAALQRVLQRMLHEGWLERLAGYGWAFTPILTSAQSYQQGYRLRIIIEPAAILEPTFMVDEATLRHCRDVQRDLVGGAIATVSPAQLFDANSALHEAIVGFSGNAFMLDALQRLNRVRRLIEYRKSVDRQAAAARCREHLELIDLLLAGDLEAAADFLRLHLRTAARLKAQS